MPQRGYGKCSNGTAINIAPQIPQILIFLKYDVSSVDKFIEPTLYVLSISVRLRSSLSIPDV